MADTVTNLMLRAISSAGVPEKYKSHSVRMP